MTEDEEAKWISEQCAAYEWLQKQPMVTVKRKVELYDDLLEALKELQDYAIKEVKRGGAHQDPVWAKVADAIAKAEGRT